ncbi:hypothetical protein BGX31_009792 [Mortierella sp. GBA43]|nr:hypothetical protein BGX31_009792 [Mortierella sp. GBA43]
MNDSEELAEKYHKLFQDYTRIKAQHAVLKKAVLKEQTENATIQAALKEKEQEVRKSLQELDLLSFHNQRLTKRIENLQNQAAAKPGGSWLMGGTSVKKELEKSQSTLEAATIDLQAKIEENEKLHQQLYEINALYPRHVTELQGKIQALEKQNQELQVDVERVGVANEDTINLIRKEKEAVEKELHTTRDALAGQLKDERRVTQSLQNQVQELQQEYDRLSKVERELYSLQSEHSKLEGELETFKWISSELSQLQTSYSALERDKGQVEKAHAQLTQQYGELKQAEEKLRGALMQEQERHRVIQEHHSGLSKQLEATRGEASERERGFHVQIQQLEGELSRAHKEQEQLKVQYEELKAAEQSAKEGESRTKTDLAKELTIMKSDLERAESTIKEMENVKATLEKDLLETKKSLEETSSSLEALRNRRADDSDDAGTKKEEQVSETGEVVDKDKPVEATEAVESSDAQVDEAAKDSKDDNDDAGTTAQDEAAVVSTTTSNADKEADDQKRAQEEQARREVENALRAEIETLKAEIETSQQVNATKDEQLTATLGKNEDFGR